MVERDGCNIFTGITLSSEALAVVPKLEEWNAIFLSSDWPVATAGIPPPASRSDLGIPISADLRENSDLLP